MALSDPFEDVSPSQCVTTACFTAQSLSRLSAASHDRNHPPISERSAWVTLRGETPVEIFSVPLALGLVYGDENSPAAVVPKKFIQWETCVAQILSLVGSLSASFRGIV